MDVSDPTNQWIIGLIFSALVVLFGFFWRMYQHHNRRIEEFKKENHEAHTDIHEKIADTDLKSQERHSKLRDKIDDIWQILVKGHHN